MNKKKKTVIAVSIALGAICIGGVMLSLSCLTTETIYHPKSESSHVSVTNNQLGSIASVASTSKSIPSMLAFKSSESISLGRVNAMSDRKTGKDTSVSYIVEDSQKQDSNSVKLVKDEPVSTFSIDTDNGSYKLFKRELSLARKLNPDLVREEEFINAFDYDYPTPDSLSTPFSTTLEIFDSPWSDNKILKIGIRGYEVTKENLPPVNLVFLVDTSGSMQSEMPKIKIGINSLINKLRPQDKISIVTYAGGTQTLLKSTPISNKHDIVNAIEKLSAGGGTNGESGIKLAYNQASSGFIENGVNRILLLSDGDFNVGINNVRDLEKLIKEKRKSGITFSTIGISDNGGYRDGLMESMANKGNGNYTFIGDMEDAREVFADRFTATLVNIAKDVKTQIEFNPGTVKEYRLIGYQNRLLKREDFNNDNVDAGEIPSGMSATILYEFTPSNENGLYEDLRYENVTDTIDKSGNEYAFLKIRYKEPNGIKSKLISMPVSKDSYTDSPSDDSIFATSVAGFAQLYKQSKYIGEFYTYDDVIKSIEKTKPTLKRLNFSSEVKSLKDMILTNPRSENRIN